MADIFISYSSKDRQKVTILARELARTGWTVWWDPVIPPGQVYDVVIEEQVKAARCIVVCWSESSTQSSWVRAEAGDALNRGILVPVLIEPVDIPLVFRQVNAANLVEWSGAPDDERYNSLLASLAARLGDPPNSEVPIIQGASALPGDILSPTSGSGAGGAPAPAMRSSSGWRPLPLLAAVVAATAVGTGIWGFFTWQQSAKESAEQALIADQRAAGLALKLPKLAGTWETDYGVAQLKQVVDQVEGRIRYHNGNAGEFRGLLKPHDSGKYYILDFNWKNGADFGNGILDIQPGEHGTLRGYWEDQRGTRGKWVWTKAP